MPVDLSARRSFASRTIAAPASAIFEVLSDASLHSVIDGSGQVRGSRDAKPERLALGSRFGMKMRIGLPYRITNEVVEFEQDRRIAWRHIGRHIWRYELEPINDNTTKVTETFDWSPSPIGKLLEIGGYPKRHLGNIERTLERLEAYLTNRSNAL